jgi:hypothetical protein
MTDAAPDDPEDPDDPDDSPPGPRKQTNREICTAACKASQKCGVLYATPCIDACLTSPASAYACYTAAGTDCNKLASCGIAALCGEPPSGSDGCSDAAECMISCGQSQSCLCGCMEDLTPRQANILTKFLSCVTARCISQCQTGAANCMNCVQSRCAAQATACLAR